MSVVGIVAVMRMPLVRVRRMRGVIGSALLQSRRRALAGVARARAHKRDQAGENGAEQR
jgi:hypothetical protein